MKQRNFCYIDINGKKRQRSLTPGWVNDGTTGKNGI